MVFVLYRMFEERENGMWTIVHSLPKGRMYLGCTRVIVIAVTSFLIMTIFYISTLFVALFLYDGVNTLLTPIQTISQYGDYTYNSSKWMYLLLLFFSQWLAILMISFMVWLIFAVIRKRNLAVFMTALVFGLEYILYLQISAFTIWNNLNKINLVQLFDMNDLLTTYQNVGVGQYVIQLHKLVLFILIVLLVIFIILGLFHAKFAYPSKNKSRLQRFFDWLQEKYQIVLAIVPITCKELHKLWITSRGIWITVIMICLVLYFSATGQEHFSAVEQSLDQIYLDSGGEDYTEIVAMVEQTDEEYAQAVDNAEQVSEAYKTGEATLDDVMEATSAVDYYASGKKMVAEFKTKISYLAEVKEKYDIDGWMISDRGYEQILGDDSRNRETILLLLLIVCNYLIISDSFQLEYKTGMISILHSTARGRKWIDTRKIGICIGISILNWAIVYLIDYKYLSDAYGMPYLYAPLRSLMIMSGTVPNVTILAWILIKLGTKLLLVLITAALAMIESKLIKKSESRALKLLTISGLAGILVIFRALL